METFTWRKRLVGRPGHRQADNISLELCGLEEADERMGVADNRIRWRGLFTAVMGSQACSGH